MTPEGSAPDPQDREARSRERFRVAVEGSPSGILLADRTGSIVMVNRHVEKMFGYRREELLGQPVETLVPQRFRQVHVGHRTEFQNTPEMRPMGIGRDLWGVRKDGTEFPVEIGLNPLETEEGPMVLASIVDISRERALERTLAHAEKLTALGQLAAGVAHEINTPLTNISLVAESVRRRSDDEWVRRKMEAIVSQVEVSSRIVRGLLDFSRRREPTVVPVELVASLRQAMEFVRAKVPPDVAFEARLPPPPMVVLADADQLRQVFTNLFLNASEAMGGKGAIRATIARTTPRDPAESLAPARPWVEVLIEDSGPGIPLEVLPHIFEPFFTTKSDSGGTGLGLSVVHGIVGALGGRIEATNRPEGGARFRLLFPLAPADRPGPAVAPGTVPSGPP